MKKPFSVGDRVRVYDGQILHLGKIDTIGNFQGRDYVKVELASGEVREFHPKQCRLLKARAKPEVKEPRRVWVADPDDRGIVFLSQKVAEAHGWVHGSTVFEFTELPPNSVVVTKEKLAEAWAVLGFHPDAGGFPMLRKALGLDKGEA